MTLLLQELPYFVREELFFFEPSGPGRYVTIWARQIPIRISLRASEVLADIPSANSFPAILDTGFNGTLVLSRHHLRNWAGLTPEQLGKRRRLPGTSAVPRFRGLPLEVRDSPVWIRPNLAGTWNPARVAAYRMDSQGVFVVDFDSAISNNLPELRLPLVGMRAFDQPGKKCRLQIDFAARRVQLRV